MVSMRARAFSRPRFPSGMPEMIKSGFSTPPLPKSEESSAEKDPGRQTWRSSRNTATRTTRPQPFSNSNSSSALGGDTPGGRAQWRRLSCDPNVVQVAQNAEYIKQPKDDYHHHHDIENLFDLAIHRDVGV